MMKNNFAHSISRKIDTAMNRISHRKARSAVYVIAFMVIGFILPWWSILLVAGIIGWVEHGLLRSSLVALVACFIAWFLLTLGFDILNGFRISTRLGGLIGIPLPIVANILAATLGGLVAALAAATMNQLRVAAKEVTS